MAYDFNSHRKNLKEAMLLFPWLLAAQIPEGLLSLIQKYFEVELPQSPKLAFLILYPLYCAAAAICSSTTYLIITTPSKTQLSWSYLIKKLNPKLRDLIFSSWVLGIVMIPATLALILPGIWVLSHYQFLPFSILDSSAPKVSSYFDLSKQLYLKNRRICLLTALLSFVISLIPYLGLSMFLLRIIHPAFALGCEVISGMILSVVLTTWTATLYQEILSK